MSKIEPPKPIAMSNAQRKRVHLRRDRAAVTKRSIAVSPARIEPLPERRIACRDCGPEVVVDHWLSFGPEAALEQFGLHLDECGERNGTPLLARRFRERIAVLDSDEYAVMVDKCGSWRTSDFRQLIAAYLLPGESEFSIPLTNATDRNSLKLLLFAVTDAQELSHLDQVSRYSRFDAFTQDTAATLGDALGVDFLPYLYGWLSQYVSGAKIEKQLVALAMEQQTEQAWDAVASAIDSGHQVPAARRDAFKKGFKKSPELSAKVFLPRLVASHAFATKHRYLGEQLVHEHRDAVDAARSFLDEKTIAFIDSQLSEVSEINSENVPQILVNPPWENRPKRAKRLTVADVEPLAIPAQMCWAPNEHETWSETSKRPTNKSVKDWDALEYYERMQLLLNGDRDEMRPYLAKLDYPLNQYHKDLAARFELDLRDAIVELATRKKQSWETPVYALVVPYGLSELAEPMVELYGRGTHASRFAVEWLRRHDRRAAVDLIPRVVSPERKGRSLAEAALRVVVRHNEEVVRSVAADYGLEVEKAIAQFLAIDPLDVLPTRVPKLPEYLRPAALLPPVVRENQSSLPPSAVENIVIMLALSKETEYAGIPKVAELCEPDSLAAFALSLHRAWYRAGAAPKDKWLASGIDRFGNDSIVDEITGELDKKNNISDEVRRGQIDALERLGTDEALASLFHLSGVLTRKVTIRDVNHNIRTMAELRGLSTDQLADRLIRTFDLDSDGSKKLDFGPRSFTVAFDKTLAPVVCDDAGKVRKKLPKPSKSDDPELAAKAHREFKKLKSDVRDTAKTQIKRFEHAMVIGRRWPRAEFQKYFVDHPLMRHLVRRLVWGVFAGDNNEALSSFRLAEDGSLTNSNDDEFVLDSEAAIGLPHPVELQDLAKWSEVFSDYEIDQPFEQLGRAVYDMANVTSSIEVSGDSITFVGDPTIPYRRLLGLTSRGWADQQIGSSTGNFNRQFRSTSIYLSLLPGFQWGTEFVDQRVGPIRFAANENRVDTSELLRDLMWLSRPV